MKQEEVKSQLPEGATLRTFFEEQIAQCKYKRALGTAENYRRVLRSLETFLGDAAILFEQVTPYLVTDYEQWLLDKGLSRNSTSFYLRNLRSIYNKAVAYGLTVQNNPFRDVYTGVDKTRKRAVSEDVLLHLQNLDLNHSKALSFSRDLFIFSYCTRGMAFVDMAFLKKADVSDDAITYVRRKTGVRLSVRIEPCIRHIIKKYAEATKGSPYIFPIVRTLDPETSYKQYLVALCYHNRKLKRLTKMLDTGLSLSSYTARHSWATAARKHNVPLAVISEGMGHTNEKTTQIYLSSFDNSVIDEANKNILQLLNRTNSM